MLDYKNGVIDLIMKNILFKFLRTMVEHWFVIEMEN